MPDIRAWSTTAADNDDADASINWLEGQLPSTVNNSARAMMAAVRGTLEGPDSKDNGLEWWDSGMTPTRTGNTTFTVTGDQTAKFVEGRMLRLTDSATLYAIVVSSAYTSLTTVTVTVIGGTALSASLTKVFLSPQMPTNTSGPVIYDKDNLTLTTGSANAYIAAPTRPVTSLRNGMTLRLRWNFTNSGAATLAVSGLTAKSITKNGGTAVSSGDLISGNVGQVTYVAALDSWELTNSVAAGVPSGTPGQILQYNGSSSIAATDLATPGWNFVYDPEFQFMTGAVSTSDNGFIADGNVRLLLAAANAATASQITSSLPTGARAALRLTAGSGNNNKAGFWITLESKDVIPLRGKTLTLTFQAKATAALSNIKAGVVEWTSTADGVSGDPISAWNSSGTTPTLNANWAFLNTPANLSVGTSYAKTSAITVAVGSSATNLHVFIWWDVTATTQTTDQLEVTQILLHTGNVVAYQPRSYVLETKLTHRFFHAFGGDDSSESFAVGGVCATTSTARVGIPLGTPMRAIPTLSVSAATDFNVAFQATVSQASNITLYGLSRTNPVLEFTCGAVLTAGDGAWSYARSTTNARLYFDARI